VVEVKDKESNPDSESDSKNIENKQVIDVDPNATVVTTIIQLEEQVDPEEREHLFYSQMWVKGTLLHLIIDRGVGINICTINSHI
jgi:hypothetical protein